MATKKLLFIPGYFGSTLVDEKTNENRWVRVSDFFSNKYDLRMHQSYSDLPDVNPVVAGDILYKVKIIPKILEIESYDKTLKHLKNFCQDTQRELHTVTYDWREDFYISILRVIKKINELTADGEKIEIVAHSNGGMLISYILRFGDQDFPNAKENWWGTNKIDKLSIVASPLHGAFSLFRHLKFGTSVLQNKKMMSGLNYSSFRSTYFFLPHQKWQKGILHDVANNKEQKFLDFDLFNVENWKRYKWGPYRDAHQIEIPVNDQKFKELLLRARQYNELMQSEVQEAPTQKVKIQVMRGLSKRTFFYPTFPNPSDLENYTYPKEHKIDGDGIVGDLSAKPLFWFHEFDLTFDDLKAEHLKIICELKFQKYIHQFLSKN